MKTYRIGIMGFGLIGRQIFRLAQEHPQLEIVAVSDPGRAEILHHLLTRSTAPGSIALEGNYLVTESGRTRLLPADRPGEIPWDVFDTDVVIDATGRFRTRESLQPHLDSGARRVVLSTLPEEPIDRVLIKGVNESTAAVDDRVISAGSASTTATALALKTILASHELEHASMTSVHAYTSDQSLQDYAGPDYRRSRSGAENIIPNHTPALAWVQEVLPELKGKMTAYALNVPVQTGSLLDLSLVFSNSDVTAEDINALFVEAEKDPANRGLIETTIDPIVSSDVKGCRASLLVDLDATIKAGERTIKLLGWHESLGHAQRLLDISALYCGLDTAGNDARKEKTQ